MVEVKFIFAKQYLTKLALERLTRIPVVSKMLAVQAHFHTKNF